MATQGDFFPDVPLPEWLPDELLFSLLSRFHRISGNLEHTETCQQLFGPRRKRCAHDLPHWIQDLSQRARGVLGTADCIIHKGTLLPVYLPFLSQGEALECYEALKGPGLGKHRSRLCRQIPSHATVQPLRACPQCMELDRENLGVSYWHLSHQLPGVFVCVEHSQPLWSSSLAMDHGRDVRWHLPKTNALCTPEWTPDRLGSEAVALLKTTATLAMEVFSQPKGLQFNVEELGAAYLRRLDERRPGTNPWNIEVLLAHAQEMQRYFGCLDPVKDFEDAYGSTHGAASAIGDALSLERGRSIPWNHLLMMTWLSLRPSQEWA
jgi:hypothetical protein